MDIETLVKGHIESLPTELRKLVTDPAFQALVEEKTEALNIQDDDKKIIRNNILLVFLLNTPIDTFTTSTAQETRVSKEVLDAFLDDLQTQIPEDVEIFLTLFAEDLKNNTSPQTNTAPTETPEPVQPLPPLRTFADDVQKAHSYGAGGGASIQADTAVSNSAEEPIHRSSQDDTFSGREQS